MSCCYGNMFRLLQTNILFRMVDNDKSVQVCVCSVCVVCVCILNAVSLMTMFFFDLQSD